MLRYLENSILQRIAKKFLKNYNYMKINYYQLQFLSENECVLDEILGCFLYMLDPKLAQAQFQNWMPSSGTGTLLSQCGIVSVQGTQVWNGGSPSQNQAKICLTLTAQCHIEDE
jgi:hypothetical protein